VPEDIIKPLLEESFLSEARPYENIIATCWVRILLIVSVLFDDKTQVNNKIKFFNVTDSF
jgi:hypothetical protein